MTNKDFIKKYNIKLDHSYLTVFLDFVCLNDISFKFPSDADENYLSLYHDDRFLGSFNVSKIDIISLTSY